MFLIRCPCIASAPTQSPICPLADLALPVSLIFLKSGALCWALSCRPRLASCFQYWVRLQGFHFHPVQSVLATCLCRLGTWARHQAHALTGITCCYGGATILTPQLRRRSCSLCTLEQICWGGSAFLFRATLLSLLPAISNAGHTHSVTQSPCLYTAKDAPLSP